MPLASVLRVRIEQVELLSVRKKRAPIAPTLELIHADKINDSLGGNLRQRSSGEAQFHKTELLRMVRVGAERNARTLFAGDFQKTDPQVLPIRTGR